MDRRRYFIRLASCMAVVCSLAASQSASVLAADLSWDLYFSETSQDAGVWEVFVSGDKAMHAGLASYSVQLSGNLPAVEHRSPNGFGQGPNGIGAIGFAGFGRSPNDEPWLTATQDTISNTGMIVYDFGVLSGDIAVTATPTPIAVFTAQQPIYGAPLQIASGSWSGVAPAISATAVAGNVFDLSRNGTTQAADHEVQVMELLPGDANRDGVVDGSDFLIWNANKFTSETAWGSGDFNGDGVTDGTDFLAWNANKFTSLPTRSVPEPLPGGPAFVIGLLFVGRRVCN